MLAKVSAQLSAMTSRVNLLAPRHASPRRVTHSRADACRRARSPARALSLAAVARRIDEGRAREPGDGGGGGALGNLSEGRLRIVKRAAKEFEGKRAVSVQHLCLFCVSPLLCVFCCCWTVVACLLLRLMYGYCINTAWILHGIVIMDE